MVSSNITSIIEQFPNSHAAQQLEITSSKTKANASANDFDAEFGHLLKGATEPKQINKALAEAKKIAGSVYARELVTNIDDTIQKTEILGRYWTAFADWSTAMALAYAYHTAPIKRFFPELPEPGQPVPGLFILGLGKMGGCDLNYSSDIDLVSFFDADTFNIRPGEGKTDIAGRVLKTMTQILSGTNGERIWRVDWRLRPDPSVTGLSMSVEAGLEYFFFKSAPWRRLAMMKARPVAGDSRSGERFIEDLIPFVWRKTLDFRAINDIADLKSRIHEEHPELESERQQQTPLETAENFNVKLGTGGIREIEFTINALQLVWGGRQPSLRTTHTLTALQNLATLDLIPEKELQELGNHYSRLRGLENRIQLMANAHTHILPTNGVEKDLFLSLTGNLNPEKLMREVVSIRKAVHGVFESHFTRDANKEEVKPSNSLIKKLDENTRTILHGWLDGFVNHGLNTSDGDKLLPLKKWLLNHLEKTRTPVDDIDAINRFFNTLPPGGQYLFLLAEFPQLAGDILPPLTGGGAMANLLNHSPHVVDTLIQRKGRTNTNPDERLELVEPIFTIPDYGSRLEAVRSFVNEMLYLVYLEVWRGECSALIARRRLTKIAEEALHTCMKLATNGENIDETCLSVLGFGKLGMEEMMPESDLDLVFLAHGKSQLEIDDVGPAHRLADRFKTALTAEMRGGKVYETDTRLRPSGQSGAPTVRLATFREHQINRAKTWEHLALVPARFVCGPNLAKSAFEKIRAEVLSKPRDQVQLAKDAYAMLVMLREHRIKKPAKGTIAIKLMPGGLMEAEYLVSFLVLSLTPENTKLAHLDYCDLAGEIEAIAPKVSGIGKSLRFLQDVHFCERLYGWSNIKFKAINFSDTPLESISSTIEINIQENTALISKLVDDFIVHPSNMNKQRAHSHQQVSVGWQ